MEREVAALVHLAAGRRTRRSTRFAPPWRPSERCQPAWDRPGRSSPRSELLGEVLLETGRAAGGPRGVRSSRCSAIRTAQLRFSVRRAAVAAGGDRTLAGRHYATLLVNWREADGDVAELAEAERAQRRGLSPFSRGVLMEKGDCPLCRRGRRSPAVVRACAVGDAARRRTAPRTAARAKPSRKRSGR